MLYVTGDTHKEWRHIFYKAEREGWTQEDCIIVCGDTGLLYHDDEAEHAFLDEMEKKPYTVCFIDGNHENFDAIARYPQEEWNGGRIHRIRKNVIHLMRGQVFVIQGKKIFTMGGAYSVDEATKKVQGRHWAQEVPTWEECKAGLAELERHGNEVDYILTHTAPAEIIRRMGFRLDPSHKDREFTGVLEHIMYSVRFGHWFFGHFHIDRDVTDRVTVLMSEIRQI